MKRIFIILILVFVFITGCKKNEKVDYSEYLFTSGNWTRDTEYDIETIRFSADGEFSYSCACGNPVNDADLCETYTYNDKTKEIKLECIETTEETITTIKVVEATEDELKLDFDGDIRIFKKANKSKVLK